MKRKSSTRKLSSGSGRKMRRKSSNKWCEVQRRGWRNSLQSIYTSGEERGAECRVERNTMNKLQAPGSRLQRNTKLQTPVTRRPAPARASTLFGVWNLKFL